MKTAAVALPPCTALGAEWFKAPIDFRNWAASAQTVWTFYKRRVRHRKRRFKVKDRDIGQAMKDVGLPASRRTVQRGHWFLEFAYKVIERDWSGGHGREVVIKLPLAGDDKEEKTEADPKPKAEPKPPPSPKPKPDEPATADDRPLEPGEARRMWERAQAQAKVEADAGKAAVRPRAPLGVDGVEKAARELGADELARLEALEARGELTSSERRILEATRRIHAP
jgi:hypothetical protein